MAELDIIDTHCHLDVAEFDADREAVLQRARAAGVVLQVIPGVDAAGWPGLLDFCRRHSDLRPALGLHPIYLDHHRPRDLDLLRELLAKQQPVAVGEIGLDFYVDNADRQGQQQLFEAQLHLAAEFDLPVVLHIRKAHDAVLATLKRIKVKGGVAHAFNGSPEQARQYEQLGFRLGFGGMLTYERSNRLRRLARELPLELIVLETDAPDMATSAHHGERNSPEYLPEVLAALAEIRGEPIATVAAQTTANARAVFGLG